MHLGVLQGPMKQSTIKFQVRTCIWFLLFFTNGLQF
jgi:hypothetical protein